MIIIYGSTSFDFLAIAEGLKAQGLVRGKDYQIKNERCFMMAHITEGEVYTASDSIALHYQSYPNVLVHRIPDAD